MGSVHYRLKQAGIKLHPPTLPSTNEQLLETERVFQREGSRSKAAKALGVAISTVRRRLNQLAERRDRGLIAPPKS
jgi:DNA invertase Pin-like site-specific DNA recombinase